MSRTNLIIVCLSLVLSAAFIGNGLQRFNRFDQTISVKGLAERVVQADLSVWTLELKLSSNDLETIKKKLPRQLKIVNDFLLQNHITEDEIQKTSRLTDRQAKDYADEKGDRYVAQGSFIISSKDVKKIEALSQRLEELLSNGVVIADSKVNYHFTNLNAIKPEMLNEAAQNARVAAQGLAKSMHVSVGKLLRASQGSFSIEDDVKVMAENYEARSSIDKKIRVVTQVEFLIK